MAHPNRAGTEPSLMEGHGRADGRGRRGNGDDTSGGTAGPRGETPAARPPVRPSAVRPPPARRPSARLLSARRPPVRCSPAACPSVRSVISWTVNKHEPSSEAASRAGSGHCG